MLGAAICWTLRHVRRWMKSVTADESTDGLEWKCQRGREQQTGDSIRVIDFS